MQFSIFFIVWFFFKGVIPCGEDVTQLKRAAEKIISDLDAIIPYVKNIIAEMAEIQNRISTLKEDACKLIVLL